MGAAGRSGIGLRRWAAGARAGAAEFFVFVVAGVAGLHVLFCEEFALCFDGVGGWGVTWATWRDGGGVEGRGSGFVHQERGYAAV